MMPDTAAAPVFKITVATVVLNSVDFIESTISSILTQTHDNIEFVVIDGGSTDGTLEVIEKYRDRIDHLLVERDRGIYDAMNKAIKLATGDYIIFMNSGDEFASDSSVADLCNCASEDVAFVYGGWVVKYPWGHERLARPASPENFWRGMFVQHQSVMVKTQHLVDAPFSTSVGLGADYASLLQLVASGVGYRECHKAVSRVSAGGLSDNNRVKVLKSHWSQARLYYPGLRTDVHYLSVIGREFAVGTIKRLLPVNAVRALTARKPGSS